MRFLLFLIFISIFSFAQNQSNIFYPVYTSVFSLNPNRWEFIMDKRSYGVEIAGYLKGYNWKNSPVIIYAEAINTNYYFDLFTKLTKIKRQSKFNHIQLSSRTLPFPTTVSYDMTLYELPNVVYEYVTYFDINKHLIMSFVMSSKDKKLLGQYYNDYKVILQNFSKVTRSFKNG